ncbi:homeobox-domain-containing protein [Panus rudis PR-1116 ss-1]|nr:homeobox-domain-containing protein [Panus rudis PR-1116 ss-1]
MVVLSSRYVQISQTSQRFLTTISKLGKAPRKDTHSTLPSSHRDIRYTAPYPRPIVKDLIAIGLSQEKAEDLSKFYLHHATLLKKAYESNIRSAWRIVGVPTALFTSEELENRLRSVITAQYLSKLDHLYQELVSALRRQLSALYSGGRVETFADSKRKPQFKQSAVPLLEDAFAHNAYPSRDEKIRLANQLGMDYKQVHVWFQNKRARAKRDGWEPRKDSQFVCTNAVDETLLLSSAKALLAQKLEGLHTEPFSFTAANLFTTSTRDVLEPEGALHAFPSPYPPLCPYDPFPIANSSMRGLSIPWPRQSDPSRASSDSKSKKVDIDSVISAFSRMSISDDTHCPPCDKQLEHLTSAISFSIIPPSAPLPALLRPRAKTAVPPAVVTRVTVSSRLSVDVSASFTDDPLHRPPGLESAMPGSSPVIHSPVSPANKPHTDVLYGKTQRISRSPSSTSISSLSSLDSWASESSSASDTSLLTPPSSPPQIFTEWPSIRKSYDELGSLHGSKLRPYFDC